MIPRSSDARLRRGGGQILRKGPDTNARRYVFTALKICHEPCR